MRKTIPEKKPLYRRVNTRARNVHHGFGGDYRHTRNSKAEKASEAARGAMGKPRRRGLDYTPLFMFLLSKVGEDWDAVYREAAARLDRPDPIFWIVAREEAERRAYVRVGEGGHYSGLYVDQANRLQRVDPSLTVEQMEPPCGCCTHTFNGVRFVRPYRPRDLR